MSTLNLLPAILGDTYVIEVLLRQANGAPQDLTDCAIRFGISPQDCLKQPFITKTVDAGITVIDAAGGRALVRIERGELNRCGMMAFELEATLPNGESYTYAQGRFVVKEAMYPG